MTQRVVGYRALSRLTNLSVQALKMMAWRGKLPLTQMPKVGCQVCFSAHEVGEWVADMNRRSCLVADPQYVFGKVPHRGRTLGEVLLTHVTNTLSGCREWAGYRNGNGYGVMYYKGKDWLVHRLAFAVFVADTGELKVLHRCDNPACVNPEHLFLGSQQDNMSDKVSKGRQARGERHGMSKLSDVDRAEIAASSHKRSRDLANTYGVSTDTTNSIRRKHGLQVLRG